MVGTHNAAVFALVVGIGVWTLLADCRPSDWADRLLEQRQVEDELAVISADLGA